jgi:hypothetical protein
VPAAHACNPSYSGGRDQEDHIRSQPGQVVCETLSRKNPSPKRAGVAPSSSPSTTHTHKKRTKIYKALYPFFFKLSTTPTISYRVILINTQVATGWTSLPDVRTHPCLRAYQNSQPASHWPSPGLVPGPQCSPQPRSLLPVNPLQKATNFILQNLFHMLLCNSAIFSFFQCLFQYFCYNIFSINTSLIIPEKCV